MGEPCAQCVVFVHLFTNGLESLYVSSDLPLSDIEVDAKPITKLLFDYVKHGDHVVYGIGD
jgi:hypothetical protein